MRAFADFFSGIAAGLRIPSWRSCTKEPPAARGGGRAGMQRHLLPIMGIAAAALLIYIFAAPLLRRAAPKPADAPPDSAAPALQINPDTSKREWKYIVIHHSATARGSAQSFDQYHRLEKGWDALGYHFVIGNGIDQGDGVVVAGPRWREQKAGAHANTKEHNEHGIGICLVGNFNESAPTPAQLRSLRELVDKLCSEHHIPHANIFGHNHIRQTDCPGKHFPIQQFRY
jgi:N-acetyl-anhydromuramyl-L-alanine amidase AmpD